jgi:hypothetical protein
MSAAEPGLQTARNLHLRDRLALECASLRQYLGEIRQSGRDALADLRWPPDEPEACPDGLDAPAEAETEAELEL